MTIGALWRTIVMYKSDRIFILDARDPSKIRSLIAAIYRQRLEQNLKKEEEYFALLFEILRNP
jgi:DNA polymerase III delta prime subunit